MDSSLNVYYQNCRGLRTKTSDFYLSSLSCEYDLICVTESWLKPHIDSSELICDNYNVFRRDRCQSNSSKKDGGGVLLAVSTRIKAEVLSGFSGDSMIEDLWLKITVAEDGRNLILCVCYCPPNTNTDDFVRFFNGVSS